MNKELSNELVNVIKSISEVTGEVKNIAIEQLPIISEQILRYNLISNYVGSFISLILFSLSTYALQWGIKNWDSQGGAALVGGIGMLGSFMCFVCDLNSILKIHLAPQLYLISKFKDLLM